MSCEFERGSDTCKTHGHMECRCGRGLVERHCYLFNAPDTRNDPGLKMLDEMLKKLGPPPKMPDDLGLPLFSLGGVPAVTSDAVRRRIESEGRWGFFAGLMTGLLIAGLVFIFGPP